MKVRNTKNHDSELSALSVERRKSKRTATFRSKCENEAFAVLCFVLSERDDDSAIVEPPPHSLSARHELSRFARNPYLMHRSYPFFTLFRLTKNAQSVAFCFLKTRPPFAHRIGLLAFSRSGTLCKSASEHSETK